ncbi:hypothetical protein HPP92_005170 [Vanilla planifolia]|uniref:Protein FAR1-RELATED SEQUENCE n=1 Tax=Vanilla planifolia TaxID=51239 RepID=A0A835RTJ4_VANPL|nr:hypothetical protein HPP92_005170 [Vanilla planifolia]
MMIKTSLSNGDLLGQRQLCPCGDNLCYINTEIKEEHSVVEPMGPGDSYLVARSRVSSELNNAVLPPFIGQSFQSDEEALVYYSSFARNNGFSVRRERSKGNPEHPMGVYKRELVCHRAGPPLPRKTDDVKRQRSRKASRCKCEAQMVIKKNVSAGVTRWVVVNFSNIHNHEFMDSSEVPYPSPHQNISSSDRDRILALAKNGCAENLILRTLELEKGLSPGQLAFGERDIKIFLLAFKNINRDTEGMELLKVCRAMKEKNPDFKYEYTSDDNNKLGHVAWSYASSVRAFKVFGDVAVLDTTFHLNAYNRPVGVWFGIDNYGHTIFFCCVILLDEKPESMAWALQAFRSLMDGKLPQTIMTDVDMGLKDAISTNLPEIKQSFCIWHVLSKLPSWFSASLGSEFDRFRSEFQKIYDSESMEEFEDQWSKMVMDFGLVADKHASFYTLIGSTGHDHTCRAGFLVGC